MPKSPLNIVSFFSTISISEDAYYILSRFGNAAMYLLLFSALTSLSIVTLYHQYGLFANLYTRSGASTLLDFYNYLIDFSGPASVVLFCFYYYWLSRYVNIVTYDFLPDSERKSLYARMHKDDIKIALLIIPLFTPILVFYPSSLSSFFERSTFDRWGHDHFEELWFIYLYSALAFCLHKLALITLFMTLPYLLNVLRFRIFKKKGK